MNSSTATLILGLAGLGATLISSALGLYFTARARTAGIRQLLYDRQLSLTLTLIQIVGKIRVYSSMIVGDHDQFASQALRDLRPKVRELAEAVDTAAALLPTELYVATQLLLGVVTKFLVAHDDGKDTSWYRAALDGHSAKVALLARAALGVDELSIESAKLFGTAEDVTNLHRMHPDDIARSG
jgi:hypothetical protein